MLLWIATAAIAVSGCSRPPASASSASAASAADPVGVVSGRVPDLASGVMAFVFLQPKSVQPLPPQDETPAMDQVGQTFGPAILFVRTGQPVTFRNNDDTLHNVHVTNEDTREGAFNVAIPTGSSYMFTFKQDGFYHVGCDIHPAMSAEIVATSTPYAMAAEPDGSYAFDDVVPGEYTLMIYSAGKRSDRGVVVTAPQRPKTPSPE